MELQRIETLISRYLDGQATPEEQEEVERWYAMIQPENESEITSDVTEEEQYAQLLERIGPKVRSRNISIYRIIIWSAAAMLLLSLLIWPLYKNRFIGVDQNHVVFTDKGLKMKNTILTLSDGRQINIDEQQHGKLEIGKGLSIDVGRDMLSWNAATGQLPATEQILSTPYRRRYSLLLPDGTRVWLNAGSNVSFPAHFSDHAERHVSVSGEAYFEVAHATMSDGKTRRPFTVTAGGQQIAVLGTRFNVKAYAGDQVVTTLFHGSVSVGQGASRLQLKPGEAARSIPGGLRLEQQADLDRAIAWRSSLFIFEKSNLKEILSEFSRWYGISVIYHTSTSGEEFSGKIPMDIALTDALKIVEQQNITFRLSGDKLYVEARK
jgi:ferric-dicitrate binding protein FerR (iron transport regulator)